MSVGESHGEEEYFADSRNADARDLDLEKFNDAVVDSNTSVMDPAQFTTSAAVAHAEGIGDRREDGQCSPHP